MSTETIKEVQTEMFESRGTMLAQHAFGDIAFFNTDLVTPNMINILMASLDDADFNVDGHGVLSVVFRDDGYPMHENGLLNSWAFSADACCAMCNIEHCITLAIEDGLDPKNEHAEKAGVHMGVWKNMLKGFFHETYHARSTIVEPHAIRFDKEFRAEDEGLAPIFARDQLFELAKIRDIEIDFAPEVQEMIDIRLLTEFDRITDDKKATKRDKAWKYHQQYLIEHGGVFYAPPSKKDKDDAGLHLMTFKEYLHFFSDDAEDDPAWAADTIGVALTAEITPCNEDGHGNSTGEVVDPEDAYAYADTDEFTDAYMAAPTPGFQGVVQQQAAAQVVTQQVTPVNPVSAQMQEPVQTVQPAAAPLPPTPVTPAAQQVPVVAGAANAGAAFVLASGADPQTVVDGLYLKMFTQIFQACQYNHTSLDMPFPGGGNITQWLELTEDEAQFVVSMTCYSAEQRGVECPGTKVERHLSGIMMDKAGLLPGYRLVMAMPDGTIIKRTIMPQNPNKVGNNGYVSTPAKLAKGGSQIMWIIDADTKEYKRRIKDGAFERNLGNYQWGL